MREYLQKDRVKDAHHSVTLWKFRTIPSVP